jgi:hypothetical protein
MKTNPKTRRAIPIGKYVLINKPPAINHVIAAIKK